MIMTKTKSGVPGAGKKRTQTPVARKNIFWIQQVLPYQAATHEICKLEVSPTTWERLHRILPLHQTDELFDCWIDLMDSEGNLIGDKPFIVRYHQAIWLLQVFFKQPRAIWTKVKSPPDVSRASTKRMAPTKKRR